MPIQWHPVLVRLLREEMHNKLEIEEEHTLGEAPLRIDIVINIKVPVEQLPSPYCYMNRITLVQYKSPLDSITARDMAKLEVYAILYQLDSDQPDRSAIGVCVAASKFTSDFLQAFGATINDLNTVESGISLGILDGFPLCNT